MNRIEKKMYFKATLLSIIVLVLVYVSYFYLPQKMKDSSLKIINKKQKIEQINIQNNQIENIKSKYDNLKNNVDNASEHIINYSNIYNFVIEIRNAAEKNNVDIHISVSSEGEKKVTKFLSYINYDIKARGKFSDIMKFLNYLENLKYYTDVEKINITGDSENEINYADVVFDSSLKVYVRDNK